jgi:iron complex transport system substrate-binding protein
MRVVSLAPSATASVAELGGGDRLVGVTHHCEGVAAPPVGGWLNPDYERVADRDPDVVLTSDALQREVRDELRERGFDVAHREPSTLDDVLASFAAVGEAVGLPESGAELEAEARDRVESVRDRTPGAGPVVYCEEWSDPPMAAGNWVPDVVEAAGGQYPFVDAGDRSTEITADDVEAADPDHVVVHVCGKGDRVDPDFEGRGWHLDAAVHVVDDSLLNQPSPRLLDGLELLADRFRAE